jgi:pyruvate dehydrogenase (quinone)
MIERLHDWGVDLMYGYPGDGINGLLGALNRHRDQVRFIQTRHEELAAFMACAHAKFTGRPGVCIATSGPGAIHLLNGLYDAKKDHTPVVAIVGQQPSLSLGADFQQEVDLISLFKDVAGDYVHMCSHPAQARHLIDRAMRIAAADRTVTCVIIPHDVQTMDAIPSPPRQHGATYSGIGYVHPRVLPTRDDLEAAARVLNDGKRVAMLIGKGAAGAAEEVMTAADLLGAGVAKALLAKAVLADDLPYVTGSIGLLGTRPSYELMRDCDTFFMIGTSFPYSEWLPKEGKARGVQIDIKPRMLGLRYPMEVNLCGDTRETLRALIPLLERKQDRMWRELIERSVRDWWTTLEERAMYKANPINPQRVFWELSPRLPDNCILTSDSGSSANWWARDLKARPGMLASLSGGLATMGPGMPYALAAKFAYPDRPVIACVGDGAMQMNGNNVLITVAAHWQEWEDPRLIVLVLNNRDLNQVTWEQRVMDGEPKFEASQTLPAFEFARYAELLGLRGILMERPDDIASGWEQALHADRPVVVDAHTDPEVPPLPPHIRVDQARKYMESIYKGDPNRWHNMALSAKDLVQSFRPRPGSSGRREGKG